MLSEKSFSVMLLFHLIFSFSVKGNFFMGLRNHTWQSGDEFTPTHGIISLLNDQDSGYPHDGDSSCGILVVQTSSYYKDGSCNNRVEKFVCEIVP